MEWAGQAAGEGEGEKQASGGDNAGGRRRGEQSTRRGSGTASEEGVEQPMREVFSLRTGPTFPSPKPSHSKSPTSNPSKQPLRHLSTSLVILAQSPSRRPQDQSRELAQTALPSTSSNPSPTPESRPIIEPARKSRSPVSPKRTPTSTYKATPSSSARPAIATPPSPDPEALVDVEPAKFSAEEQGDAVNRFITTAMRVGALTFIGIAPGVPSVSRGSGGMGKYSVRSTD